MGKRKVGPWAAHARGHFLFCCFWSSEPPSSPSFSLNVNIITHYTAVFQILKYLLQQICSSLACANCFHIFPILKATLACSHELVPYIPSSRHHWTRVCVQGCLSETVTLQAVNSSVVTFTRPLTSSRTSHCMCPSFCTWNYCNSPFFFVHPVIISVVYAYVILIIIQEKINMWDYKSHPFITTHHLVNKTLPLLFHCVFENSPVPQILPSTTDCWSTGLPLSSEDFSCLLAFITCPYHYVGRAGNVLRGLCVCLWTHVWWKYSLSNWVQISVIGMLSRRWSHYICQRNWIADNSR